MCFLVCYLPGGILRLIFVVQSLTPGLFDVLPRTPAGRDRFFYVYMALNLMLISLNSMLNPLVFIPSTAANRERRVRRQNIFRRDTMSNNCNWHEIGAMQYFVCVWRSLNVFVLKRTKNCFELPFCLPVVHEWSNGLITKCTISSMISLIKLSFSIQRQYTWF